MSSPAELILALKIGEYLRILGTAEMTVEAGAVLDFRGATVHLPDGMIPAAPEVFAAGKAGLVPAPTAADAAALNLLSAGGWKTLASLLGLTTAGDMLFLDGTGKLARLPRGDNGQFLSFAGGLPAWVDAPTGGGVTTPPGSGGTVNIACAQSSIFQNPASMAFASSVTAGNLIVVCIGSEADYSGVTVTDTQGNTYTRATFQNAGSTKTVVLYAVASVSGANTVNLSPPVGSYGWGGIAEFSGVDASALAGTANVVNNNSPCTATVNASSAGLVFACAHAYHNASTFTAGDGMTLLKAQNGSDSFAFGFLVASAPGSAVANFACSDTQGGVSMSAVAFRSA